MMGIGQQRRVRALEGNAPLDSHNGAFLWFKGVPLNDALAKADLSLDDKPLLAIQIVGVQPDGTRNVCPLHERDGHLVA